MAKKSLKYADFLKNLLPYQKELNDLGSVVGKIRAKGKERVNELTFPQPWFEDWRFTDLKPLTKFDFKPSADPAAYVKQLDIKNMLVNEAEGQQAVFVDGWFSEELSDLNGLPDKVKGGALTDWADSEKDFLGKHFNQYIGNEEDIFTQFSSAFAEHGFAFYLPENVKLDKPVQILHIFTGNQQNFFTTSRNLVVAEKNSDAVFIESYHGLSDNKYFTLPVSEFKLDEGARIKHIKIQKDSPQAVHIARPAAHVAKNADYQSYTFTFGARLFRNDPHIIQTDEEVSFTLDGLVLIKGDQIADTHSTMDHKFAFAESHQLHKVVVDEKAHSIFNGKIFVRPHAQKIDSFQENRNLMISRDSTIDTKPQLEIFADDVVCSHGATVGQLETDELFYLQTRGLDKQQAQQILIQAFALDTIENIAVTSVRERLLEYVQTYTRATEQVKIPA